MPRSKAREFDSRLVRDFVLCALWLLLLALINQTAAHPVYSLFPYLVPAALLTWRYSVKWGLVFAGFAAIAAIPGEYRVEHPQDILKGGMVTYLKLSMFVLGLHIGKRRAEKHMRSSKNDGRGV